MKLVRKIKEVGLKNVLLGGAKRIKYGKMIKKYHFDSWHLSPYEWKEYAQACVKYINADDCKTVVDIDTIVYRTGSFDALVEKPVDYLVTLNFMHGGTEETWREPYHTAAVRNDIGHFIVDTVPEEGGSHFLNWAKILPENYRRVERLGPFLGGRYVEVWERVELL